MHFKHGLYRRYAPESIQEKIDTFVDADPLDLTQELALSRSLLAEFLERYKNASLDGEGLSILTDLIDKVRKTVDTIAKIKNETALTAAEVTFLAASFARLIDEMTDDPNKRAVIQQRLVELVSGTGQDILTTDI